MLEGISVRFKSSSIRRGQIASSISKGIATVPNNPFVSVNAGLLIASLFQNSGGSY